MSYAEMEHADGDSAAELPSATIFDFDQAFQEKIAALALRDTSFLQRCDGLIRPEHFENQAIGAVTATVIDFYKTYRAAPSRASLGPLLKEAFEKKRIRKDLKEEVVEAVKRLLKTDISDREFVEEQVSRFARRQAILTAALDIVEKVEKGDFDSIEKRMREALLVGVNDDALVYDYYERIAERTERRKAIASGTFVPEGITTGSEEFDRYLYHRGWGRKELSVLMGAAKAGKSMSLGEFGKNASLAGYNVIYFTLEVAAKIIADRVDANISDTLMKDLTVTPLDVDRKIKAAQAKAGRLDMIEYPTGTMKPSQVRRFLERAKARGILYDLVIVDYADIMAPEYRTDNGIENSRSIYVDLRGIAHEFNCAMLTATQSNREGAKKTTATMTDVAEDFNRVRIADVFISINATEEERASGEARLYFAAVRNSESGFTLHIQQDRERMKFLTKVIGRS